MQGGLDRFRFMSVQNVMTREVFCVKATDKIVDAWLSLMEKDISGAPVVDDEGMIVGILSVTDIYRAVVDRVKKARSLRQATSEQMDEEAEDREELRELTLSIRAVAEARVSSLLPMKPAVLTLGANDSLDRALKIIAEKNINRLPVVKDGKVVGIITRQDVIAVFSGKKR
jgi:CBS domain-containing protein